MKIVTLSGRKWAVGLWWQPLVSSPRKQAEELSSQGFDEEGSPYNVYALLRKRKQVGIGSSEDTREDSGIPALAGALARLYEQHSNVLALFRFDDGNCWLFALKDGQILPGGDFYGDEEAVSEQYRRYSQSDVWKQVFETSGTEESEQKILESIDALDKKLPVIRPVSRGYWMHMALSHVRANPKLTAAAVVAFVLFVGGTIGLQQYTKYREEAARQERLEEKRAEMEEKRQQEKKSVREIQDELFPAEWAEAPDPVGVVRGCYTEFKNTPYQQKGWSLAGVICGPEEINVIRQRSSWASFTVLPEKAEFQIKDPSKAVQTLRLDSEDRQGREIIDKETVSANIYELAGILNSPVELTWEEPEPREVPDKERERNPELPETMRCPYWIGEFQLKDVPESFLRDVFGLNRIPGLVVDRVKKDESWSIKGEVYAD